jgi:hypothetical protein
MSFNTSHTLSCVIHVNITENATKTIQRRDVLYLTPCKLNCSPCMPWCTLEPFLNLVQCSNKTKFGSQNLVPNLFYHFNNLVVIYSFPSLWNMHANKHWTQTTWLMSLSNPWRPTLSSLYCRSPSNIWNSYWW